jgi:sulfur carrier protein ThiS
MSPLIHLRLYEELNDFLPVGKRKRRFSCGLKALTTVGDLVENLGVPPELVELVLVNGDSVVLSHALKPGDFVSLFPVFESLDVTGLVRLRRRPLRNLRFLTGPRLVRLMRYLRCLDFYVLDAGTWPRERIIRKLQDEREILLTRDPDLANNPGITRVYFVRETTPKKQVMEVIRRFDLANSANTSRLHSIIAESQCRGAVKP